ncbi:translation initiation factor IF-2-like [Aquila chrysaetos chrysaetos]|uniref:translation initiation factor IF-2-like n=1 Tax=Aquila chrysaetos chrysaetos TaxID=223781 RepID=UPI0005D067E1|nr:translation initiation factor IF-2-like [Aquila chrysaetos chrysaetos]
MPTSAGAGAQAPAAPGHRRWQVPSPHRAKGPSRRASPVFWGIPVSPEGLGHRPASAGEARDGSRQGCGKDLPGTAKGSYGEKMEAAALLAGGETVRPGEPSAPPRLHHAKWTPPPSLPPAPVPVLPTPGPLHPPERRVPHSPAPRWAARRAEVRRGEARRRTGGPKGSPPFPAALTPPAPAARPRLRRCNERGDGAAGEAAAAAGSFRRWGRAAAPGGGESARPEAALPNARVFKRGTLREPRGWVGPNRPFVPLAALWRPNKGRTVEQSFSE